MLNCGLKSGDPNVRLWSRRVVCFVLLEISLNVDAWWVVTSAVGFGVDSLKPRKQKRWKIHMERSPKTKKNWGLDGSDQEKNHFPCFSGCRWFWGEWETQGCFRPAPNSKLLCRGRPVGSREGTLEDGLPVDGLQLGSPRSVSHFHGHLEGVPQPHPWQLTVTIVINHLHPLEANPPSMGTVPRTGSTLCWLKW